MDIPKKEAHPPTYVIRIKNNISPGWEAWFDGMEISHTDHGETVLTGELVDQAAVYGLLEKIHSLNLCLLSIQQVDLSSS
jgi:glycyl-tRNA synthetase alpha subunit